MTITRFAPSPTGALHLGSARTALFNYLFAKHEKGKFLLRIEDTDKKRSTPEAVHSILDGLKWLGLDWDGEVVYQSQRAERHRQIVEELLAKGAAYYCDCSAEKLAAAREKAIKEKLPLQYDRTCRDRNLSSGAVRIKMPRTEVPLDGTISIDDKITGKMTIKNAQLDDFIIQRTDGSPTYMLCVVVDDHDMEITHIIRGNDHATNAARQAAIYKAMEWEMPIFAHIPLIHGTDGAKLSKRRHVVHGAQDINEYQQEGYLPAAMRNYLARLGWAHGDDETFSTEEAIGWFSLEGIGKSPARFDQNKLDYLNKHYMKELTPEQRFEFFAKGTSLEKSDEYQRFTPILERIAERSKTLTEFTENARFLIAYENSSGLQPNKALILKLIQLLEESQWDTIKGTIEDFAKQNGGLKETAQAMRIAIIGQKNAPSIFDVINALGKNETLKRLKRII